LKKQAKEAAKLAQKQEADAVEVQLEKLTLDPSLPTPKVVKIRDALKCESQRIHVYGFIHHLRQQGECYSKKDFKYLFFRQELDFHYFARWKRLFAMCLVEAVLPVRRS
jgi:hypothetical protein